MNGHAEPHPAYPSIPCSKVTVYTRVQPYEMESQPQSHPTSQRVKMGYKYVPSDIVKLSAQDFSISGATLQWDFSGNNNTYKWHIQ